GVIPVSTTLRMSIPRHAPWKSQVGIERFGLLSIQISRISSDVLIASLNPPVPTKRVTPGAAIIAIPPTPYASVIAESPMSGQASSELYPVKYRPSGVLTGAVNHWSPKPDTLIPNWLPLRERTVTIEPSVVVAAVSITDLAVAIIMFK